MHRKTVTGGGGTTLSVVDAGNPQGRPIVFIHGFSQSALAWQKQFHGSLGETFRLVALDIRGHGLSDKPEDPANYTDSELWADDIDALITGLELTEPVLVGWSYGGLILCDYLRKYGHDKVGGLVFVDAVTKIGSDEATAFLGPKLLRHVSTFFSTDASESVETLGAFIRDNYAKPLENGEFYRILGYNCVVPPHVRSGLFARALDNDDVLSTLGAPTLVVHGDRDEIVLPKSSRHVVDLIRDAQWLEMRDVAHCPFSEDSATFDAALHEFAAR